MISQVNADWLYRRWHNRRPQEGIGAYWVRRERNAGSQGTIISKASANMLWQNMRLDLVIDMEVVAMCSAGLGSYMKRSGGCADLGENRNGSSQ